MVDFLTLYFGMSVNLSKSKIHSTYLLEVFSFPLSHFDLAFGTENIKCFLYYLTKNANL